MAYSWTQPLCEDCWFEDNPDRTPVRIIESKTEVCVDCGESTKSGIYIRIDPIFANFPSLEK